MTHNGRALAEPALTYAGRTNVFEGRFELGTVQKNYEVLDVEIIAVQANTANYGSFRRTFKLIP